MRVPKIKSKQKSKINIKQNNPNTENSKINAKSKTKFNIHVAKLLYSKQYFINYI